MQRNVIETLVGAVVLAIAGGFGVYTYSLTNAGASAGYQLRAQFDRVDGLAVGADVRVSGIKVGNVSAVTLDPKSYMASVTLTLDKQVKVPADSIAQVATEGLLGGHYLALLPGADDDMLPAGGVIRFTQPPLDLMQLIGRAIFTVGDQGKDKPAGP